MLNTLQFLGMPTSWYLRGFGFLVHLRTADTLTISLLLSQFDHEKPNLDSHEILMNENHNSTDTFYMTLYVFWEKSMSAIPILPSPCKQAEKPQVSDWLGTDLNSSQEIGLELSHIPSSI